LNFLFSFIYESREIQRKNLFLWRIQFQNFLRSAVVLSERESMETAPMLQPTFDCIRISNFDVTAQAAAYVAPVKQPEEARRLTQYDMKPIVMPVSHPLILDSNCSPAAKEDGENIEVRSELERLFPQDSQLRELLLPIVKGEAITERRRLELEACLKFPHVLDLQEAFVKNELGEELTEFEQLLLRRMDGAVDFEVLQQD
jgi:hypothetical protein